MQGHLSDAEHLRPRLSSRTKREEKSDKKTRLRSIFTQAGTLLISSSH